MFKKSQFIKDVKTKYDQLKMYFTALVPGCDTGSIPGSECHKNLIFKNITINGRSTKECEILAGRAGAYKPRKMQILVRQSAEFKNSASVEIGQVRGYDGMPQLMNYSEEKGLSDVFKEPVDVDFNIFGVEKGHGLKIEFYNPNDEQVNVYISLWGDAATYTLLGRA